MLYVATTRAKDYLYIASMAKKDASKISTMGDVLGLSIGELADDFEETNLYEIVDDIPLEETPEIVDLIHLQEYPTTNRLSELYVLPQEKHLKHILNIEKSGRRGSLLHDVLANANNDIEANDYLSKLFLEGDILQSEIEELKQSVLEVLNHTKLKQILSQSTENIIEKNIIDANGKLHRPDRILINNKEVIILDYKFTLEQSDKHIEQILNYKDLLTDMGYENIKSYLFYAVTGELKLV
jgi:ATP-dependent exoDNAse (exonuclease V) beta subunit